MRINTIVTFVNILLFILIIIMVNIYTEILTIKGIMNKYVQDLEIIMGPECPNYEIMKEK